MRQFQLFMMFFLFGSIGYAQKDSINKSSSWVPKELKGEVLYVEKYSEVTVDESIEIVNGAISEKTSDKLLDNIYSYNVVFRRKINNEIQTVFNDYELGNIATASTRDIRENLKDDIRFILKAEYSAEDLIRDKSYNARYYIYDQETKTRYKSFWSLEATLKSLKSFNWYANNRITDDTAQASVDDYMGIFLLI